MEDLFGDGTYTSSKLPNYMCIYLFICLPNYMCVYLIKKWKICLEMEQVRLPIYMYVYLIRRTSAHVEGGKLLDS